MDGVVAAVDVGTVVAGSSKIDAAEVVAGGVAAEAAGLAEGSTGSNMDKVDVFGAVRLGDEAATGLDTVVSVFMLETDTSDVGTAAVSVQYNLVFDKPSW